MQMGCEDYAIIVDEEDLKKICLDKQLLNYLIEYECNDGLLDVDSFLFSGNVIVLERDEKFIYINQKIKKVFVLVKNINCFRNCNLYEFLGESCCLSTSNLSSLINHNDNVIKDGTSYLLSTKVNKLIDNENNGNSFFKQKRSNSFDFHYLKNNNGDSCSFLNKIDDIKDGDTDLLSNKVNNSNSDSNVKNDMSFVFHCSYNDESFQMLSNNSKKCNNDKACNSNLLSIIKVNSNININNNCSDDREIDFQINRKSIQYLVNEKY
jgi:hypothetical protein